MEFFEEGRNDWRTFSFFFARTYISFLRSTCFLFIKRFDNNRFSDEKFEMRFAPFFSIVTEVFSTWDISILDFGCRFILYSPFFHLAAPLLTSLSPPHLAVPSSSCHLSLDPPSSALPLTSRIPTARISTSFRRTNVVIAMMVEDSLSRVRIRIISR